ncbi:MAG: dihydroorotase [Gemmatimonas sp.]
MTADTIEIISPDDWHVHLRDGAMLKAVVAATARVFSRALVMPNLNPPVTTVADARSYRERIVLALPKGAFFIPLMTCYLTDETNPDELEFGFRQRIFLAAKLYPAHATTNSARGVTDIAKIEDVLARMEEIGMPLCIHGEVTDRDVDIFDREAVFIDRILAPLRNRHPALKIVFEHITTKEAAEYVAEADPGIAATITPHHLMINRNAMFEGGIRPHHYCLPVAKREVHRLALRKAAVSGNPRYFLGTDSAPHQRNAKEATCGCAGVYNAPAAIEAYAQVFEEEGALDRLEGFASKFGPAFYGLQPNAGRLKLERSAWVVPEKFPGVGNDAGSELTPFLANREIRWRVVT